MSYKVHITRKAESDIESALDYIEYALLNQKAADSLLDYIEREINSLSEMPQAHQLANDSFLNSLGIRYLLIKNYIAFYLVDDETETVHVLRFLYNKRNWIHILKAHPIDKE